MRASTTDSPRSAEADGGAAEPLSSPVPSNRNSPAGTRCAGTFLPRRKRAGAALKTDDFFGPAEAKTKLIRPSKPFPKATGRGSGKGRLESGRLTERGDRGEDGTRAGRGGRAADDAMMVAAVADTVASEATGDDIIIVVGGRVIDGLGVVVRLTYHLYVA